MSDGNYSSIIPTLNGSSPARTPSVIMGRQDYISILLRLTANVGFVLLNFLGILAMVLMGTIVGGEYSLGTVRLMFTRGPTRLQFLFAKIVAITVCIVIAVLVLAVAGVLAGLLFDSVSGIAPTYGFFTSDWFGHMLLYILYIMFTWFVYSIVALAFAVIGRATVVGIVGALVWFFVEPILTRIIYLVTQSMTG